MKIQDLESIDKRMEGLIRRSPNIRLLTLFRHARLVEYISLVGDYPLIHHLITLLANQSGLQVSRWSILKTVNKSEELSRLAKREKTDIIDQLLLPL